MQSKIVSLAKKFWEIENKLIEAVEKPIPPKSSELRDFILTIVAETVFLANQEVIPHSNDRFLVRYYRLRSSSIIAMMDPMFNALDQNDKDIVLASLDSITKQKELK